MIVKLLVDIVDNLEEIRLELIVMGEGLLSLRQVSQHRQQSFEEDLVGCGLGLLQFLYSFLVCCVEEVERGDGIGVQI